MVYSASVLDKNSDNWQAKEREKTKEEKKYIRTVDVSPMNDAFKRHLLCALELCVPNVK